MVYYSLAIISHKVTQKDIEHDDPHACNIMMVHVS